jgi:hypothetical protein
MQDKGNSEEIVVGMERSGYIRYIFVGSDKKT